MVYKSKYCCYQYLKNCADLTEVFIGDTNVITEIIFSDYYRTFLLCILSIGVVFFMRNASIRKKVLALAGYEFIVFLLFLWIFIVCIIFTEFDYESIIAIVQWELKWILYFTISIILQFAMYYFFWKKSKILKIVTLLFSLIIVIVPLHVFDFTWNNKIKKWNPTNANYKTNRANIISLFICVILYRLMCIVWKNDKIWICRISKSRFWEIQECVSLWF